MRSIGLHVFSRCAPHSRSSQQRFPPFIFFRKTTFFLTCIPYKYSAVGEDYGTKQKKVVQVLMINSSSGPGLLFPKGMWENDEAMDEAARREALEEAGVRGDIMKLVGHYNFQSKTHQDQKLNPEGLCKAVIFALLVKEELNSWPEQSMRQRECLSLSDAAKQCRHRWMEEALHEFRVWHEESES